MQRGWVYQTLMTELWPGFVSVFGVLAWGELFEWFHFYVGLLLSNSPYIDRLVQDCSISSVLATEILQYFTKLSTWSIFLRYIFFLTRYVPKFKYPMLSTNKFIWWHIRVRDPVHKLISSVIIHSIHMYNRSKRLWVSHGNVILQPILFRIASLELGQHLESNLKDVGKRTIPNHDKVKQEAKCMPIL